MNKNTPYTTPIKKKQLFSYEGSKIKKDGLSIFTVTSAIQIGSLIFFFLIGKLEQGQDTITSFAGIIAISTTISMCGIAIYGAILLRKRLIRFYIGEQRNRIFLFPIDRKELFMQKTASFLAVLMVNYILALISCLAIAILANVFLDFTHSGLIQEIWTGLLIVVTSSAFLYTILIVSEIMAIYKQSEITTIVTALVLMLSLSNLTVIGLVYSPFSTVLTALLIAVIVTIILHSFANRLKSMEVS